MSSARRNIPAVTLLFIMSSLSGTVAFPQAVKFIRRAADPLPLANMLVGRAPCRRDSGSAVTAPHAAIAASSDLGSPCNTPPVKVPSVNPCNASSLAQIGCKGPRDLVQEDLAAMGKPGQKILRARERVLGILQTENACSAWFREKGPNPAATFRTLTFAVDGKAEDFILQSKDPGNLTIFRNPYVAKVFQDDGAYATV